VAKKKEPGSRISRVLWFAPGLTSKLFLFLEGEGDSSRELCHDVVDQATYRRKDETHDRVDERQKKDEDRPEGKGLFLTGKGKGYQEYGYGEHQGEEKIHNGGYGGGLQDFEFFKLVSHKKLLLFNLGSYRRGKAL
jgi:hypothetical protein